MPKRVHMKIAVPHQLKTWIERQVELGNFPNESACVEAALKRARTVSTTAELESLAIEGVQSGPATPLSKRDFARIKALVHARSNETATKPPQRRKSA